MSLDYISLMFQDSLDFPSHFSLLREDDNRFGLTICKNPIIDFKDEVFSRLGHRNDAMYTTSTSPIEGR
jgi:hypothetical protein